MLRAAALGAEWAVPVPRAAQHTAVPLAGSAGAQECQCTTRFSPLSASIRTQLGTSPALAICFIACHIDGAVIVDQNAKCESTEKKRGGHAFLWLCSLVQVPSPRVPLPCCRHVVWLPQPWPSKLPLRLVAHNCLQRSEKVVGAERVC